MNTDPQDPRRCPTCDSIRHRECEPDDEPRYRKRTAETFGEEAADLLTEFLDEHPDVAF